MKSITAIILGGGRGSRLYPLTIERAKPAVGFAGKYRLIDIPISNCINSGIKRMFVLTQFLSASLHRHIMQTYQFDTFSDGFVDIIAAEQTPHRTSWFQGTADAVRATLNHTQYFQSDHTLILSGDHLYRMDYSKLIRYHNSTRADITICVYPVTKDEASDLGLMRANKEGIVDEFVEKPKDPTIIEKFVAPEELFECRKLKIKSNRLLASMGIYVFKSKVLNELLIKNKNFTDFGKDVMPTAIDNYKVIAYPFDNYWKDIGTIRTFFDANISLARENPPFELYYPQWPIYTRTRSLPPSRIIRSNIMDSLLTEGSDIQNASIMRSVIGMRSIIKKATQLNEVVMLGADFYDSEKVVLSSEQPRKTLPPLGIGENCQIEHAIIDKNARIGNNVVIKAKSDISYHEGENYYIRDGITIIPKGAILEDGTKI